MFAVGLKIRVSMINEEKNTYLLKAIFIICQIVGF
jgi:hypothetical protein